MCSALSMCPVGRTSLALQSPRLLSTRLRFFSASASPPDAAGKKGGTHAQVASAADGVSEMSARHQSSQRTRRGVAGLESPLSFMRTGRRSGAQQQRQRCVHLRQVRARSRGGLHPRPRDLRGLAMKDEIAVLHEAVDQHPEVAPALQRRLRGHARCDEGDGRLGETAVGEVEKELSCAEDGGLARV